MRALTHQSRFDPKLYITRYLLNPPSGKYLKTANMLPHATNMLDYLCSELLDLAGNITIIDHRVVVKRADVEAAIENNHELLELMSTLQLPVNRSKKI